MVRAIDGVTIAPLVGSLLLAHCSPDRADGRLVLGHFLGISKTLGVTGGVPVKVVVGTCAF
jgi:hypothetical protein